MARRWCCGTLTLSFTSLHFTSLHFTSYHLICSPLTVVRCGVWCGVVWWCVVWDRPKFSASNFFRDCHTYQCTVILYIGQLCRCVRCSPHPPPTHPPALHVVMWVWCALCYAVVWVGWWVVGGQIFVEHTGRCVRPQSLRAQSTRQWTA